MGGLSGKPPASGIRAPGDEMRDRTAPAGADGGRSGRGRFALVAVAAALLFSVLSWAGVCTGGCEEAHQYRLFGVPLPPFGVAFFSVCILAILLRRRLACADAVLVLLLSGALGSEIVFLWTQKFVIGEWCPLCVGIALSAAAAAALLAGEHVPRIARQLRSQERSLAMRTLVRNSSLVLSAFLAGMILSAVGLGKHDAHAAVRSGKALSLGIQDAGSEVYVITDWFCPACRAVEGEIVKGAQRAMMQAKVVFVDFPIHQETLNFIPYNMSFMIREKEKYLRIREVMLDLARKNKEPTPEDVQAAVAPLGVKYVPLNYADVVAGTQYFNSVIQRFQVKSTPTVVVTDTKSGKTKFLSGANGISSESIAKALAEVLAK